MTATLRHDTAPSITREFQHVAEGAPVARSHCAQLSGKMALWAALTKNRDLTYELVPKISFDEECTRILGAPFTSRDPAELLDGSNPYAHFHPPEFAHPS